MPFERAKIASPPLYFRRWRDCGGVCVWVQVVFRDIEGHANQLQPLGWRDRGAGEHDGQALPPSHAAMRDEGLRLASSGSSSPAIS